MMAGLKAALFIVGGLLALVCVACWTVAEQRGGVPHRLGFFRWAAYLVSAGLVGYGTALAAALAAIWLIPAHPELLVWSWLAAAGGFLAAALAHGAVVNRLRRRAGLRRGPLLVRLSDPEPEHDAGELPADIQKAMHRAYGLGAANPGLWLGGAIALFAVAAWTYDALAPWRDPLLFAVSGVAAMTLAWLWCAIVVPRWRVWALSRVEDIELLELAAVNWWLLWSPRRPLGRLLTRSEIWTPALRRDARRLRRGRGGPAWSGDL